MEIVEIWQNLGKNATQIMIFLRHYYGQRININKQGRVFAKTAFGQSQQSKKRSFGSPQ